MLHLVGADMFNHLLGDFRTPWFGAESQIGGDVVLFAEGKHGVKRAWMQILAFKRMLELQVADLAERHLVDGREFVLVEGSDSAVLCERVSCVMAEDNDAVAAEPHVRLEAVEALFNAFAEMHFRIARQKALSVEVAEHGVFDVHDFAFERVVEIEFESVVRRRGCFGFVHRCFVFLQSVFKPFVGNHAVSCHYFTYYNAFEWKRKVFTDLEKGT